MDYPPQRNGAFFSYLKQLPRVEIANREIEGHQIPVFFGEFWTARQRAGHSLHEISYRACFKPQLPAFFLTRLGSSGKTVYDPFMGRGTTLVEAQLHGWRALGNDANPLARILAAPRLSPPGLEEIRDRLQAVDLPPSDEWDGELLVFFAPETLREIYGWRTYFRNQHLRGKFDRVDAWLQMVASNRLTGHSPGFFSVYTLPPNQATSIKAQRRINARRNQVPELRDTRALIWKKSRQLLKDPLPRHFLRNDWQIWQLSADSTPEIPADSVDLVVTSPPFLNTVDYVGDNWLRAWFCELQPEKSDIWQMKSLGAWSRCMTAALAELRRVLRPEGLVAFEVGEVLKGQINLENEVVAAGLRAGLSPWAILINQQRFTKTANCWGVANNEAGTNSNRVVLFCREG